MLPKKHRRSITVDGELYCWHFTAGREIDHRPPQLVIQLACGGQLLVVKQSAWPDLTPAHVQSLIMQGLDSGWQPRSGVGRFDIHLEVQSSDE